MTYFEFLLQENICDFTIKHNDIINPYINNNSIVIFNYRIHLSYYLLILIQDYLKFNINFSKLQLNLYYLISSNKILIFTYIELLEIIRNNFNSLENYSICDINGNYLLKNINVSDFIVILFFKNNNLNIIKKYKIIEKIIALQPKYDYLENIIDFFNKILNMNYSLKINYNNTYNNIKDTDIWISTFLYNIKINDELILLLKFINDNYEKINLVGGKLKKYKIIYIQ